jgi:hypothetical protein
VDNPAFTEIALRKSRETSNGDMPELMPTREQTDLIMRLHPEPQEPLIMQ